MDMVRALTAEAAVGYLKQASSTLLLFPHLESLNTSPSLLTSDSISSLLPTHSNLIFHLQPYPFLSPQGEESPPRHLLKVVCVDLTDPSLLAPPPRSPSPYGQGLGQGQGQGQGQVVQDKNELLVQPAGGSRMAFVLMVPALILCPILSNPPYYVLLVFFALL